MASPSATFASGSKPIRPKEEMKSYELEPMMSVKVIYCCRILGIFLDNDHFCRQNSVFLYCIQCFSTFMKALDLPEFVRLF